MARLSLTDGEGLKPLRYVDLEASGNCSQSICQRRVADAQILILGDTAISDCQVIAAADLILVSTATSLPEGCSHANVIYWPAIVSQGGLSWRIKRGELSPISKPPCNVRPWHPCVIPDPSRSDE